MVPCEHSGASCSCKPMRQTHFPARYCKRCVCVCLKLLCLCSNTSIPTCTNTKSVVPSWPVYPQQQEKNFPPTGKEDISTHSRQSAPCCSSVPSSGTRTLWACHQLSGKYSTWRTTQNSWAERFMYPWWMTLTKRREMFRLNLVHRCLNSLAPVYLMENFESNELFWTANH